MMPFIFILRFHAIFDRFWVSQFAQTVISSTCLSFPCQDAASSQPLSTTQKRGTIACHKHGCASLAILNSAKIPSPVTERSDGCGTPFFMFLGFMSDGEGVPNSASLVGIATGPRYAKYFSIAHHDFGYTNQ